MKLGMIRRSTVPILMAFLATTGAGDSAKDIEPFLSGMTVLFDGSHAVELRVEIPPCLSLEDVQRRVQGGSILPLDLWILDEDGARLAAPGSSLLDHSSRPQGAKAPGHWRVERPAGGVWRLTAPSLPRPWRLWSAFHPFPAKADPGRLATARGLHGGPSRARATHDPVRSENSSAGQMTIAATASAARK